MTARPVGCSGEMIDGVFVCRRCCHSAPGPRDCDPVTWSTMATIVGREADRRRAAVQAAVTLGHRATPDDMLLREVAIQERAAELLARVAGNDDLRQAFARSKG